MSVRRKVLVPTILFFAIVLVGLIGLFSVYEASVLRQQEYKSVSDLHTAMQNELYSTAKLSQGLALQAANDPEVQSALAKHDDQLLQALTLPLLLELQKDYPSLQVQFLSPPADVILRLPEGSDDVLSRTQSGLQAAMTEEKSISGLEIGSKGLGVHSMAPVYFKDQFVGMVLYEFPINRAFLEELKAKYPSDWQILLRRGLADSMSTIESGLNAPVPNTDLVLQTSSLHQPFFVSSGEYAQALAGTSAMTRLQVQSQEGKLDQYSILTAPLYAPSGDIIGVVDILRDRTDLIAQQKFVFTAALLALAVGLLLGLLGFYLIAHRALAPMHSLSRMAKEIASGNLDYHSEVPGNDEVAGLAASLNALSSQLRTIGDDIDLQVEERTAELEKRSLQLQAASEIASQISAPHKLDDLLNHTVDLVRERFNYYHTGIFLIDDQGEYAVLKAANGEPGKLLVQSGHKLKVGQSGIVGAVTASGDAHIAEDVSQDPSHYRNPILPYTRSEMALPLKASGRVIGALDVQSTEPFAFFKEDTAILQTLADQLAVAIENARLVEQLENALQETRLLYSDQIEQAWTRFTSQNHQTGFLYDRVQIIPNDTVVPSAVYEKLQAGKPVILTPEVMPFIIDGAPVSISTMLVPLVLRNQVIGVIGIQQEDPAYPWSEDEMAIAEAAASQASLTLENARLLEETRIRAERERLAGEITAKMRATNDPQTILQTAITELRVALRTKNTQVLTQETSEEAEKHAPSLSAQNKPIRKNGNPNPE